MASLYEIDRAILDCVDEETGEILDLDKLRELQIDRNVKIENIALYIKNLTSDAKQITEEKNRLAEREKSINNNIERLRQSLVDTLQGEKFKTARVNIYYSNSTKVLVDDWNNVPKEFLKYSEPDVDKKGLKEALSSGVEISGACLVKSTSLVIR